MLLFVALFDMLSLFVDVDNVVVAVGVVVLVLFVLLFHLLGFSHRPCYCVVDVVSMVLFCYRC